MTKDTIVRLSNMVRYDEDIKEYIAAQLRKIGAVQMTPPTATEPGTGGTVPPPPPGDNDRYLRCDGEWVVPPNTNTTYSIMEGSTETKDGKSGLVPAPIKNGQNLYLKGDGTWDSPTGTQYSLVSSTSEGLCPKLAGGTTKFLRADGAWSVPPGVNTVATTEEAGLCPQLGTDITKFLRNDGKWASPGTTYNYATSSSHGIVKIGSNITINNGILSLTKNNIITALGYAPSAEYDVVSTQSAGLCPKLLPSTSTYLRGDGTWHTPPNTRYDAVTSSASGLMTPELFKKLNGIEVGANKITVDTALSINSANPVQNKVLSVAINGKAASSHTHNSIDTIKGSSDRSSDIGTKMYYYEGIGISSSYNLPHDYVFLLRSHYLNTRIIELAMRWNHSYPQLWARAVHDSNTSDWQEIGAKIVSGSFTGNGSSMNISLSIDRPPRFVCYWNDSTGDAFIATPGTAGNFSTKTTTSGVVYKYTAII